MKKSSQIMGLALGCYGVVIGNMYCTRSDCRGGAWKVQLFIKECQGTVAEVRN